jgi:hypothetical protein
MHMGEWYGSVFVTGTEDWFFIFKSVIINCMNTVVKESEWIHLLRDALEVSMNAQWTFWNWKRSTYILLHSCSFSRLLISSKENAPPLSVSEELMFLPTIFHIFKEHYLLTFFVIVNGMGGVTFTCFWKLLHSYNAWTDKRLSHEQKAMCWMSQLFNTSTSKQRCGKCKLISWWVQWAVIADVEIWKTLWLKCM